MAKIKISGAKLNHPPAPTVCNASMFTRLIKRFRFHSDKAQHNACRRVLTLCILPQDFSLLQAGDSFCFRHAPGMPDYGFTPDCSPERSWALFPSAIE